MSSPDIPTVNDEWTNPAAYPIAALTDSVGYARFFHEESLTKRVLPILGVTPEHSNYEVMAERKREALRNDPDELEAAARAVLIRAYEDDKSFEVQRRDRKTGLLEADAWFNQLEVAMARAKATGGRVAVVLFDLDGFKNANKVLGHAGGDLVIKDVAHILLHKVRNGRNLSGRLGGDEFGVIIELPPRGADDPGPQRRRKVGSRLEEDKELEIAVGRMNSQVNEAVEEMNRVFAPRNVPLLGVSTGAVLILDDMTGDEAVIKADRLVDEQKDANIDKVLESLSTRDRMTALKYMIWLVSKGIVDRRQLPLKKSYVEEEGEE